MLPFIKPAHVRRFCDDEITTYTDAINSVISKLSINHGNRNILVTHQFVTGSLRSESEEISVGGSDNVDAYVFDPFDYVALGHMVVDFIASKYPGQIEEVKRLSA